MDQVPEPAEVPTTAPINEDADQLVRVETVHFVAVLPYYVHHQQYLHHADGCPQCSDPESMLPCQAGGTIAIAMDDALLHTRDTARWN